MLQAPLTPSTFPLDAVAVIYRPTRSVTTSGLANTRQWKLRFERRSAPVIEPLMGWTGGDDTLAQIELTFPSIEAAIAYARRQGFEFVVHGLEEAEMTRHHLGSTPIRRDPNRMIARSRRLEWVERTLGADAVRNAAGIDRALVNPSACFASPNDVLLDPKLSTRKKHEILRRWALDAYLIEVAMTEGMPDGEPSRLDEVIDALIHLEDADKLPSISKAAQARAEKSDRTAQAAKREGPSNLRRSP